MEVTYFLLWINGGGGGGGSKEARAIIGTLKKILTAFALNSARKGFADSNI